MVQLPTNGIRLSKTDQFIVEQCRRWGPSGYSPVGIPPAGFADANPADTFLLWFPAGIPCGASVSVASSRLGQKLDEESDWFDALRTMAVGVDKATEFLITAKGTTTHEFVCRLAELFQIPIVDFEPFPRRPSTVWFKHQAQSAENPAEQGGRIFRAFFKPFARACKTQPKSIVDELLIGLAKSAILLSVRKNGNIQKLAQRRISRNPASGTRLLINRKLTPASVESDLLKRGALAWWLYGPDISPSDEPSRNHAWFDPRPGPHAIILTLDELKTKDYLAHWTRRRVGPWPDQTRAEFLDDLIFLASRREHNEISALCRILALGRILGSHGLTRDSRDVVCFSNLPLDEMLDRRVFRPHLGRWDFEPYGIAVDREFLKRLGARPVVYGDESAWEQLSDADQAFFQLEHSRSSQIDWTLEQEWRLVGDLKLDDIPVDQAVVFVKSESEALMVSALSRWPVVILNNGNQKRDLP